MEAAWWDTAEPSGCTMAGLPGPAAALVLLCLAVGLEASPELSGESGCRPGDAGDCAGGRGGQSSSQVGRIGTSEAQSSAGQREAAKFKKRGFYPHGRAGI